MAWAAWRMQTVTASSSEPHWWRFNTARMRDTIVSVLPVGLLLRVLLVATRAPGAQQKEGRATEHNRTLSEGPHEMVVWGPCNSEIAIEENVTSHTAPFQAAS